MRITCSGTHLVAADIPGCIWLLGLVFVASGTFVLTVPRWDGAARPFHPHDYDWIRLLPAHWKTDMIDSATRTHAAIARLIATIARSAPTSALAWLAGCALCFAAAERLERRSPESSPTRTAAPWPRNVLHRAATAQDWTRFGWDAGRSSAPTAPTGLTAANVASLRKQRVAIDGIVDASAIYLHGALVNGRPHDAFFVTTTYGKTLAIDADDGAVLWTYSPPGYDTWAGSYQVTTSTPLADPSRAFIYAASPDGRIQKLAVADGRRVWSTAITNLPQREKIASPLNYVAGHVVATTGGYIGDAPPYQGHVAVLDGASGRLLHVWNSLCSDRQGLLDPASCSESGSAIWGRAGAVIDSTNGHIFVATGNGRWDGRTNWGDATLELDTDATRLIANYTPTNTDALAARDADLGSTSPVLLGGGLVAQGGKDGSIRLLDWARMLGPLPHRGGERQSVATPSGADLFTAPAVLRRMNGTWVFVADEDGTAAWALRDGRLTSLWRNGNAGTSPVVADGLVFVYDPRGRLRVYDAATGRQLAELACGSGHWNSPIVADGRIALPEGNSNDHSTSGFLDIWRLP